MVAPDDDRCANLARGDEPVELQTRLRALPIAQPADACRESLERNPRLGHLEPPSQARVIGEQLEDRAVRPPDVLWVARERRPAEWSPALAELRPDEGRHEARVVE